jgi:hypothetical protein
MQDLGEVDALIWDPPWGVGFEGYEGEDRAAYPEWLKPRLDLAESKVQNGWCCVFQAALRATEWPTLIPRPWRLMACCKNFVPLRPNFGPRYNTDYALFWKVGKPRTAMGIGRDYHLANTAVFSTLPKGHPSIRPLDQMQHLVDCFSNRGMTVLDPTMGSGSTGVACLNMGREFIGIEIEPKYFDVACRRIEDAQRQVRMFA